MTDLRGQRRIVEPLPDLLGQRPQEGDDAKRRHLMKCLHFRPGHGDVVVAHPRGRVFVVDHGSCRHFFRIHEEPVGEDAGMSLGLDARGKLFDRRYEGGSRAGERVFVQDRK